MSPMIRGAFVSILCIGFVVSLQPSKAQLREQEELRLAGEAALVEQQQIAETAGFLSVDEYKKAQAVEMPTKALYDKYLEQQAELKIAEEKRKADEAEAARLAAAAEEKRKADEAEAARLAAAAEEKRKADELAEKRLAEDARARELFELTQHISQGGNYGFIEISDIDAEAFSGKHCSEILGLKASLKPVKGTQVFGFVIDGASGEIAEIATKFSFGDNAPTYKMPNACNIFSPPTQVERSCGLDDPKYINEIFEMSKDTGIVASFGTMRWLPGASGEEPWKVITRDNGKTLTSFVVNIKKSGSYGNRRHYICRD